MKKIKFDNLLRKQRSNNVYNSVMDTWMCYISACLFPQCFEIWPCHLHRCVMFVSCLSKSLSRQEMISCCHTVFSVSFSVQSQVSVSPPHMAVMIRLALKLPFWLYF